MLRKYIILPLLALTVLATGCMEDEVGPFLKLGEAPTITSPTAGNSFVLNEDDQNNILTAFTWTSADFGYDAGIDYDLQIDKVGNDFGSSISLGLTTGLSVDDITVGKLNGILLAAGYPDNVAADLEIRVVATVSDKVDALISQPVCMSVTPYKAIVIYPRLQVPGSHQGWDPANENTVIFSRLSDGNFEGFIFFPVDNAEYKFTDGPSWDVNYGDTGADGTLEAGSDNIIAGTAGVYRLSVNLNNLTHTAEATNWGLIGSSTPGGWDSDTDMTVNIDTGNPEITLDLVAGEIKFRANDDWALNFGDTNANGSLEYGGDNIAIAEDGNYTIELIINIADYTYKVTKN